MEINCVDPGYGLNILKGRVSFPAQAKAYGLHLAGQNPMLQYFYPLALLQQIQNAGLHLLWALMKTRSFCRWSCLPQHECRLPT